MVKFSERVLTVRSPIAGLAASVLCAAYAGAAQVTTWPVPEGIAASADYRVTADGTDIPVMRTPDTEYRPHFKLATNHYSYAQFDADGEVEVKVAWKGGEETFRARPPFKRVFQPFDRDSSLVLAANGPERDVPARNAPGVVYFGPGRHRADLTVLKSGETLYLAGGALLEGAVYANGTNITIRGRGILSGAPWPWKQGPTRTPKSDQINLDYGILALVEGKGNIVRDIVLWSSWCYHLVLNEAEDCVVDNVKVLGGRVLNDDGIDPCRCRNLVIRNSFVRTQDDCIAPKFWIEGMTVSNMTLWSDCASPIRVGYECEKAPRGFRNLVFRDLEFLRLTRVPTAMEAYWARPAIQLQATNDTVFDGFLFEGIRIAAAEPTDTFLVFRTQTTAQTFLYDRAGTARNVTFRDIVLPSLPGGLPSLVSAHDDEHPITGLRFENVTGLGPVKRQGPVQVGGD